MTAHKHMRSYNDLKTKILITKKFKNTCRKSERKYIRTPVMDHELVGVLDLPYTFFIFPIFSKFKTFLTLKKKKVLSKSLSVNISGYTELIRFTLKMTMVELLSQHPGS